MINVIIPSNLKQVSCRIILFFPFISTTHVKFLFFISSLYSVITAILPLSQFRPPLEVNLVTTVLYGFYGLVETNILETTKIISIAHIFVLSIKTVFVSKCLQIDKTNPCIKFVFTVQINYVVFNKQRSIYCFTENLKIL